MLPACPYRSGETCSGSDRFFCSSPLIMPTDIPKPISGKTCMGCHKNLRRPVPQESKPFLPRLFSWLSRLVSYRTRALTLAQQGTSLSLAIVQDVAQGCARAPGHVIAEREHQCRTCDRFDHARLACLECGCQGGGMDYKWSLPHAECGMKPPREKRWLRVV